MPWRLSLKDQLRRKAFELGSITRRFKWSGNVLVFLDSRETSKAFQMRKRADVLPGKGPGRGDTFSKESEALYQGRWLVA